MADLEDSLEQMPCKYIMQVGSIVFLPKVESLGFEAIESFVALMLVTMEKNFVNLDRYVNNINKPWILDSDSLEKEEGLEEDGDEHKNFIKSVLRRNKRVIKSTIKAFNDDHEVIFDVFACGVTSKVTLENNLKTIAVVCNSQDQSEVEAACWRTHERTNPHQGVPLAIDAITITKKEEVMEESRQDMASLIMKEELKTSSGV
ncbi:hypothetical protein GOP47_0012089 [Adiantum capillus-veneris]|uniref:Uncharacterized protein n=1 Tax=Adiantum capillus-veneris TaxID=13818 RepID=A0A9D4UQ20_ADICA|nr:hypothetical protein GOP47_0012089 [Adiantum capillus-veneris]